MKNVFGDEFKPEDYAFHFEWKEPHLFITQGDPYTNSRGVENCKRFCGMISPNGWQGDNFSLQYAFGEPVWNNAGSVSNLSLKEMDLFIYEFRQHMSDVQAMQYVISRLADKKHISFDAALAYVKEKGIRTIA